MASDCVFCDIGAGQLDDDLAVRPSADVYVLPALRQRAANRGHTLVLPVAHARNLHDAGPALVTRVMTVTARLTEAFPRCFGASGSMVFQNNVEPDGSAFHLHIHVVPRFEDDGFSMPGAAMAEVPRADRLAQASLLRDLLR